MRKEASQIANEVLVKVAAEVTPEFEEMVRNIEGQQVQGRHTLGGMGLGSLGGGILGSLIGKGRGVPGLGLAGVLAGATLGGAGGATSGHFAGKRHAEGITPEHMQDQARQFSTLPPEILEQALEHYRG